VFHSDSFYSAVIQAWDALGIKHPVLETQWQDVPDLGFVVSSLFPFFRAKSTTPPVYFFPVPQPGLQVEDRRLFRNVRWLDAAIFEKTLANNAFQIKKESVIEAWLTDVAGFDPKFLQKTLHARNYVPRLGEHDRDGKPVLDTVIYYLERIFFRENCGLFFLASFENDAARENLRRALDYLKDMGIGTDRSVGHGQFEWEEMEDFPFFQNLPVSDFSINLSLFCPKDTKQVQDMTRHNNCRWDLLKRGGWITSDDSFLSYRKNSVYMFKEGCVFQNSAAVEGKSVNLRPNENILPSQFKNAILRVGKSIFVPVNIQKTWQ
jgi:CRISPR type III-A-associated RAMP protein Csm4